MPELPEVETLKRELLSAVRGKTLKGVEVGVPKMVKPLSVLEFKQKLKNKKIVNISRRAKVLVIELSGGLFLLIHLKMSGQLVFQQKNKNSKLKTIYGGHPQRGGVDSLPNKFTHIIFYFSDGSTLYFNDLRKFGWARLVDSNNLKKFTSDFGPEPLSGNFTLAVFKQILKRYPGRKIKQILTDQTLIAGVGNIYADESCFCAKIKPTRSAKSLKPKEIASLYRCIPKILKLAISKKGTSADMYIQLNGRPGGMVPYLKVYDRQGEKCRRCGAKIIKIRQNGRGTHFCPNCQK